MDSLSEASSLERLNYGMDLLREVLISKGGEAIDAAPSSIEKFSHLEACAQKQIINNISSYIRILNQDVTLEPDIDSHPREVEVARAQKALKEFGLRSIDDGVFDLVKENDVIEIYNNLGIQVYRNIAFTKLCTYSLLDLAVNSWEELYMKPAAIAAKIQSVIGAALTTSTRTEPYGVGTYVQKDKFVYAKVLRTYLVTPKFITPLVDAASGNRNGFFSTLNAEILSEGQASAKYSVL